MGTQPPPPKWGGANFGTCLLSQNGRIDQDGTWHRGGPWSSSHWIRRGPSFHKRGIAALPSLRPTSIVVTVAHLTYCWALVVLAVLEPWPIQRSIESLQFFAIIFAVLLKCEIQLALEVWELNSNNLQYSEIHWQFFSHLKQHRQPSWSSIGNLNCRKWGNVCTVPSCQIMWWLVTPLPRYHELLKFEDGRLRPSWKSKIATSRQRFQRLPRNWHGDSYWSFVA